MSEEKFTQGEWRAEIVDHSFCDTGDYITEFGIVTGKRTSIAQCFDNEKINEDEAAANTYLIAAAPEMYALLKMISAPTTFMGAKTDEVLRTAIEAVLKKARGEE